MANTRKASGKSTSDVVKKAKEALPKIQGILFPIHTEADYERAVSVLNSLLDETLGQESHPLAVFVEALGDLMADYEKRYIPEPVGSPIECLKLLMNEHGLMQRDMKALGSQGVVSEILSGKRKLNLRQVKLLSEQFHVSPSVFIE